MSLTVVSNSREKWLLRLIESGAITTPSLVIDTDHVSHILDLFNNHLPEAKLFYAVKANNDPGLLRFLAERAINFDVASANEITDVRSLGIPPTRMILSNPIKSPEAVNRFFDQGMRLAVIDNHYDLSMLQKASKRNNLDSSKVGIFVRIRIPTTDVQIDLNQKFGASEEEAASLLASVAKAGFSARGVQFHVGTQSWNVSNYKVGITTSLRVLDLVAKKHKVKCDSINIGGGFPDPLIVRESGGLEVFFASLREEILPAIGRGLNIIAEPGRVLISGACSAVCSIIGKSTRNGTPWLYLDDGAYGLFSGKFFDHKEYKFKILTHASNTSAKLNSHYVIAGPTCDSLDVICHNTLLPSDLEPGDILCAHNMGAYSVVTACPFNGFGRINIYLGSSSKQEESLSQLSNSESQQVQAV